MPCGAVILMEPSLAGNVGGTLRVAANFGVSAVHLVRPSVDPMSDEVLAWSCGAHEFVKIKTFDHLEEATAGFRAVLATASARGRENLSVVTPENGAKEAYRRGLSNTAVLFGNEARGLKREDLDRSDLVIRIPTQDLFPVLNLAQSVGIVLAAIRTYGGETDGVNHTPSDQLRVTELMAHLEESLLTIGFLDPANPQRILRKLRRLFGRAGITDNEVDILRGICRQMLWAANRGLQGCQRFTNDSADVEGGDQPPTEDSDC